MCNTFAREIEYIFYIYISYLIWALKILNQWIVCVHSKKKMAKCRVFRMLLKTGSRESLTNGHSEKLVIHAFRTWVLLISFGDIICEWSFFLSFCYL
jgi:hypothetical protein